MCPNRQYAHDIPVFLIRGFRKAENQTQSRSLLLRRSTAWFRIWLTRDSLTSLLLSLESVFATLAGAVVLHDRMSGKEYFGCVLMLAAVILAQLPEKTPKEAEKS